MTQRHAPQYRMDSRVSTGNLRETTIDIIVLVSVTTCYDRVIIELMNRATSFEMQGRPAR